MGHSVEFTYGAWQNGRRGSSSALSLSTTAPSRLADLLPGAADVPAIRSWAGVVEQSPDYLPIIDIPDRPGNYVVVTASAHGFGITPATGKVVSDLVLHGESSVDISGLGLNRFASVKPGWREVQVWIPEPIRG